MPDDFNYLELVNRMGSIEARLKSNEDKSDRIEAMLNELLRNQHLVSQSSDDRIEKIFADKTEAIKDQLRDSKARVDSLEGGRRYNVVAVAAVCGALFTVFTWFSNNGQESTRQLVTAENTAQRANSDNRINEVKSELTNRLADNKAQIEQLKSIVSGLPEFRAQITTQNSTSIQDRSDQKARLDRDESAISDYGKELRGVESSMGQKFTEVETQFSAGDQLRNVQFSDQQRKNSELQNSIRDLGGKLPEYPHGPFFQPNISQERSSSDGR